jgi:hypothetical protein
LPALASSNQGGLLQLERKHNMHPMIKKSTVTADEISAAIDELAGTIDQLETRIEIIQHDLDSIRAVARNSEVRDFENMILKLQGEMGILVSDKQALCERLEKL